MTQKKLTARLSAARKSKQEMPSLSLLSENEELATVSCGSNLYPNHMSPSSKYYTYVTLHFR